jgi:ubiquinone/menaquinone biosynthesis C-methylase UbiE
MPISGGAQFLKPQEIFAKVQIIEGMKVADLGCGNLGYFAIPAAKLVGKAGLVYAVDIQKSVLEAVHSRAKLDGLTNLETIWADLEKDGSNKIPKESVDLSLLVNILFQSKKHKEILQEASRILKKGGKLIVIDWKKIGIPFGPPVEIRVEPANIKALAATFGLRLIEETEFGDYFWGLIMEKN